MKLTSVQKDRAAGVLLGQAIGDALGVPYEFATPIKAGEARMAGGGLGPYSPGEWSDDTQMAICVARVAAEGTDLACEDARAKIAKSFAAWSWGGASDIGNQTRAVIGQAESYVCGSAMRASMSKWELDVEWAWAFERAANEYAASHSRAAGNGALMRNGIVGLTRLDDRAATAAAARAVASLTHADPLVRASCLLHAETIRVAILTGRLNLRAGLDVLRDDEQPAQWAEWIEEAERRDPKSFKDNGFTVAALQAAWSAIVHTRPGTPSPDHLEGALQCAISIGHDTDTVAAIAGSMLGALYGVSGLRWDWRRSVHGWPGMRSPDLVELALLTASAGIGQPIGGNDWPRVATTLNKGTRPLGVPLPADPSVILGTGADLPRAHELGCERVVSLCRLGRGDRLSYGVTSLVEQWLIDNESPDANANIAWVLHDAADAVRQLRDVYAFSGSDHRVLLHCARAEHRTPAVALLYAVKHCYAGPEEAADGIRTALGHKAISGKLWRIAMEEARAIAKERNDDQ